MLFFKQNLSNKTLCLEFFNLKKRIFQVQNFRIFWIVWIFKVNLFTVLNVSVAIKDNIIKHFS